MSVLNLLNSAWEAVADWRRRERAYAELMALDDHSLADIGIQLGCPRHLRRLFRVRFVGRARLVRPAGRVRLAEAHLI